MPEAMFRKATMILQLPALILDVEDASRLLERLKEPGSALRTFRG